MAWRRFSELGARPPAFTGPVKLEAGIEAISMAAAMAPAALSATTAC
jgi:hypothetical protein